MIINKFFRINNRQVFIFFLLFCFIVGASPQQTDSIKIRNLEHQIELIRAENEQLKNSVQLSIDVNDKRLADFGALATMQGSHTSWVGTLVSIVSILITILVFGAGFITYFSVRSRAITEARAEAQKWIELNSTSLLNEIANLETKVASALVDIATHQNNVVLNALAAELAIKEKLAETQRALDQKSSSDRVVNGARDELQKAGMLLEDSSVGHAIELEISTDDLLMKGLRLEGKGQFKQALSIYQQASAQCAGSNLVEKFKCSYMTARSHYKNGEYEEAINLFTEIEGSFSDLTDPESRMRLAWSLLFKGEAFDEQKNEQAALAQFIKVQDQFLSDPQSEMQELVANAMMRRVQTLRSLGETVLAVAAAKEIVKSFSRGVSDELDHIIASAMIAEGDALNKVDQYSEAVGILSMVDDQFGASSNKEIIHLVARSMLTRTFSLRSLERLDEELSLLTAIFDRFQGSEVVKTRDIAADALVFKGLRLGSLRKFEEEIDVYNTLDRRFGTDDNPEIRSRVSEGLLQKAISLALLGSIDEAISLHQEIDRRFAKLKVGRSEKVVSDSLFRKAELLIHRGANDEARLALEEVESRYSKELAADVQEIVAKARRLRKTLHNALQ